MTDVQRVADYIQRFAELIGVPIDPLDKDGYTQVARGSATVGINVLEQKGFILFLAPIMDVDTNPDNPIIGNRAFADDPDLVGRLGVAMIEGLQGGGVVASASYPARAWSPSWTSSGTRRPSTWPGDACDREEVEAWSCRPEADDQDGGGGEPPPFAEIALRR